MSTSHPHSHSGSRSVHPWVAKVTMRIRNSEKKDGGRRGGRGWQPGFPGAGRLHAEAAGPGQNLPVHAVGRVRLVMVPSLLVSHVNR